MGELDWTSLQPDPALFLRNTAVPMTFSLPDHPKRRTIHSVIECAGGSLHWPNEPDREGRRLYLADRSSPETWDVGNKGFDIFDVKYVFDCVTQNKLIPEILCYRLNEESRYEVSNKNIIAIIRHVNNQTWQDFKIDSNDLEETNDKDNEVEQVPFDRGAFINANYDMLRRPYTRSEQKEIIDYLIENDAYGEFRGNEVWKKMKQHNVCKGARTWQSMRENFIKQVFPRLKAYKVTPEQIKKFQTNRRYDYESESSDADKPDKDNKRSPKSAKVVANITATPAENLPQPLNQDLAARLEETQFPKDDCLSEIPQNGEIDSPEENEVLEQTNANNTVLREKLKQKSTEIDEVESNPSFSKEDDEKIFRSVSRRLHSDDLWRYIRLENISLEKQPSELRDRFFNHILPNFDKFLKAYKEGDTQQSMFAGLKILADLQKNNVENGIATSQQPPNDTSSESESMLDDIPTSSTPKKLFTNRKRLKVISSESEDDSLFEDLMHEPARSNGSRAFKGRGISKPYTLDEDLKILRFIAENKRYSEVGGISLWKNMAYRKVCQERTHQSMKERFRKTILPNIHLYSKHMTETDINMFRSKILSQPTSRKK